MQAGSRLTPACTRPAAEQQTRGQLFCRPDGRRLPAPRAGRRIGRSLVVVIVATVTIAGRLIDASEWLRRTETTHRLLSSWGFMTVERSVNVRYR